MRDKKDGGQGNLMDNTIFSPIRVACYSGYRSEETPRRFWIGDRTIQVENILDRWLAPDHRYFKLLGDDGAIYILRHCQIRQIWELILFSNQK